MRNMTREEQAAKILDALYPATERSRQSDVALVAACLMEIAAIEREEERGVCAKIAENTKIIGGETFVGPIYVAGWNAACAQADEWIRGRRVS